MRPSFKRGLVIALTGVFMSAAGAGARPDPGHALPARPVPPRNFMPDDAPAALRCVQKANDRVAGEYGYRSAAALRRVSALAHDRSLHDLDTAPVAAIALASYEVGIDFDLMVMKAMIESHMGKYDEPLLGGSARGLFHFMPATWLTLFSWFGDGYRNGIYADAAHAIKFDADKNPYTDDPALAEKILALRDDLYVSAFIKAKEIREDERPLLRAVLGREPTYTDYYVAHFLGLERAKTFFHELRHNPRGTAAAIFDRESADPNNSPLFYRGKRALSVREVYARLDTVVSHVLQHIRGRIGETLSSDRCIPALPHDPPPPTRVQRAPTPATPTPAAAPPETPPSTVLAERNPAPNTPPAP